MNIFVLDNNPKRAAQYHCDKHVPKMIVETTQLLSWAYYYHFGFNPFETDRAKRGRALIKLRKYLKRRNFPRELGMYKVNKSQWNHPCTKWVRRSKHNWAWTLALGLQLCNEYSIRYGRKEHACFKLLKWMQSNVIQLPGIGITQRPQAFGPHNHLRIHRKPIKAYRAYYMEAKSDFATWTRAREKPWWYIEPEKSN